MSTRAQLLVVGLIGLILGLVGGTALADHRGYYNIRYKYNPDHTHTGYSITWRFTPSMPTGEPRRDRIREAFQTWTDIPDAILSFNGLSQADQMFDRFNCQDPAWTYNGIFWGSIVEPEGFDTNAETRKCKHNSANPNLDDAIHNFAVVFDYRNDNDFYYGADNAPNTLEDFGGIATHEVGHATGFSGEYYHNWPICQNSPWQTMCAGNLPSTFSVPFGWRSPEFHDVDEFKAVY